MTRGTREIEIKLAVEDAKTGRGLLRAAGFRVSRRRALETNTAFDTPALALRRAATLLRVRESAGVATITYKGPPEVSRHKSREELELEIPDTAVMRAILERLGFRPVFRYEKYRTEYHARGAGGMATLDETPVGVYLELEGTAAWIDRTARQLGFSPGDYVTSSYARLYLDWCAKSGVEPSHMVFADESRKTATSAARLGSQRTRRGPERK